MQSAGGPTMGASTLDTRGASPRRSPLFPALAALGLVALGGAATFLATRGAPSPAAASAQPVTAASPAPPATASAASAASEPTVTPSTASAAPEPTATAGAAAPSASASASAAPAKGPRVSRPPPRSGPTKPRYDDGI
jgi:hypothetical protein